MRIPFVETADDGAQELAAGRGGLGLPEGGHQGLGRGFGVEPHEIAQGRGAHARVRMRDHLDGQLQERVPSAANVHPGDEQIDGSLSDRILDEQVPQAVYVLGVDLRDVGGQTACEGVGDRVRKLRDRLEDRGDRAEGPIEGPTPVLVGVEPLNTTAHAEYGRILSLLGERPVAKEGEQRPHAGLHIGSFE